MHTDSDMVSVITPLHNCALYLSDTIMSVLSQTRQNIEMVVVDDCSSDNSLEIAHSFSANDSRIRIAKLESNSGPAVARNTAIAMSRGRYIAFLDSDDVWHPEKLEKQIPFMSSNGYALSYTHYEKMSESGQPLGQYVMPPERLSYSDLLKSNQIGCLTAVYDASKLGKVYMPLIRKRQDYGLWLKILKTERFAYGLPESLAYYRLRSKSVSSNKVELLKYNWMLFRDCERLSICRASYYLAWNTIRKMLR